MEYDEIDVALVEEGFNKIMLTIQEIAPLLFTFLRQMDAEANSKSRLGVPRGLTSYGWHARPEMKRPPSEVEWSRRLGQLLHERDIKVATEVPYPQYAIPATGKRQRCDLVIELGETNFLWLEIKGSWRDYWSQNGGMGIYRSYLLHPLADDAGLVKSHTVPHDLTKLQRLHTPECHQIAELLIGFEHPEDPMNEDIERLIKLARLDQWNTFSDAWLSPTVPNQRVQTWLWHQDVIR